MPEPDTAVESPSPEAAARTSRGPKRAQLRGYLRDAALALLIYLGIHAYQTRDAPSGPAPTLAGRALSGEVVALERYRGRPLLLHFWATWCGVCRAEQHNIVALSKDAPVVTVASRSGSDDAVRTYLSAHPLGAPVLSDPGGALARRFGVSAYPTTFVLDSDGEIRHVEVGYTSELGLRVRMWLAAL